MDQHRKPAISEFLYRLSLEHHFRWFMVLGTGLETEPPYLDIGNLSAFVQGYLHGHGGGGPLGDPFFLWLRDESGHFPGEGWARHLLERANGHHESAMREFFRLLHQWVLDTHPAWFVEFNREPRASALHDGVGEPLGLDIRKPEHVAAVQGEAVLTGPQVRFSGFEMTDGVSFRMGMPDGVASWWGGAGRRLAMVERDVDLGALVGTREPLESLVARQALGREGCLLEASPTRGQLVCRGHVGAAWIRAGKLLATCGGDQLAEWQTQPGDRVLLLSPVLMELLRTLAPGPLPASLATADALAWVQAVDSPLRRAVVTCEW